MNLYFIGWGKHLIRKLGKEKEKFLRGIILYQIIRNLMPILVSHSSYSIIKHPSYSMEKHTWRKATTLSQNTPSARWGHASTLADGQLVLFGGYAGPSTSIQTPNTGTIYGPTIRSPWFGAKSKQKERSRPYAPMPRCIFVPKDNN